jgi:hypothetical protein
MQKLERLVHELMGILFGQVDIDIGSSTVANGVLGLVFGVVTSLVVDMAFLVQVCPMFSPPHMVIILKATLESRLQISREVHFLILKNLGHFGQFFSNWGIS